MAEEDDKDLPLKEDTRLLGRVLGDVPRAQAGEDGYERIEAIRRTSIRIHRAQGAEADAVRAELAALLDGLPIGATLDNTIPLQAVFVCDSLGSAFPLGSVPFNLDKTGSANIQGVLLDKSELPTCADNKYQIAFLIIDEDDNYFVFGTGRQVVTSTQNSQK